MSSNMLFEPSYHGAHQNYDVRFAIHYSLQAMYMPTRPLFVLQDMVAIPFLITLDFNVWNFNLVLSNSSSAELLHGFQLIPTTIPGLEQKISAILTFMHAMMAH